MKVFRMISLAFGLLAGAGVSAQTTEDSLAFVNADWTWTTLERGAKLGVVAIEIFGGPQYITVVKYKASRFNTGIFDAQRKEAAQTEKLAQRANALFAANGSYFSSRYTPTTFLCFDGEQRGATLSRELFRIDGILAIKGRQGRKIEIFPVDTNKYESYKEKYHIAIGAGPLLLDENVSLKLKDSTRFATARNPRTIIGLDAKGWIYYIVADGRSKGNAIGLTLAQAAALARYLGLKDAINFDGGGSSALWTKKDGVVNHPSDNKKWDNAGSRTVPNIIYAN